jgi:Zn-dependent peptidase ImmA (M78 family)
MPAEEIEPWLIRRSNQLQLLEDGSRVWGALDAGARARANDLGTLSDAQYRRTMRHMSAYGWRPKEPVDIGPPECPQMLERVVAALPVAGTSVAANRARTRASTRAAAADAPRPRGHKRAGRRPGGQSGWPRCLMGSGSCLSTPLS